MADIESVSKQLSSLIPDLYYDLISRVIPGIAILSVVTVSLKGWGYLINMLQTLSIGSATIFLIAAATMAYLTATLCLPIGDVGRFLLTPFVWRFVVHSSPQLARELENELDFELIRTWNPSKIDIAYRLVHERLRDEGERSVVLSKMQAEAALCSVLSGFFLLWLAATLFRHSLPQEALLFFEKPSHFAVGVVGFLLSVFALIFRNFRLWNKHLSKLHESLRREGSQSAHRATAS